MHGNKIVHCYRASFLAKHCVCLSLVLQAPFLTDMWKLNNKHLTPCCPCCSGRMRTRLIRGRAQELKQHDVVAAQAQQRAWHKCCHLRPRGRPVPAEVDSIHPGKALRDEAGVSADTSPSNAEGPLCPGIGFFGVAGSMPRSPSAVIHYHAACKLGCTSLGRCWGCRHASLTFFFE